MSTPQEKSVYVVDTSAESFERDVFVRSRDVPVLVDFWSPTCQPCLMLAPALEQLADEMAGKFVLVKAQVELVQEQAAEFHVHGIPAVFAVCDGEVVDFFEGLLPPNQLRSWIERVLQSAALTATLKLEESDPAEAEQRYRAVLAESPNEAAASIGLARVLLKQDRQDDSREIIEQLEKRGFLEPDAEKVKAALMLAGRQGSTVEDCRAAVQADPDDLQLKLQLAEALAADQQHAEALETCLELVQLDKTGVGEQARETMVAIFRVLPDDSELVGTFRRKLASALY